jgi:hypothetical protein
MVAAAYMIDDRKVLFFPDKLLVEGVARHGTQTIHKLYWRHSRYSKTSRICTRKREQAIDNWTE